MNANPHHLPYPDTAMKMTVPFGAHQQIPVSVKLPLSRGKKTPLNLPFLGETSYQIGSGSCSSPKKGRLGRVYFLGRSKAHVFTGEPQFCR